MLLPEGRSDGAVLDVRLLDDRVDVIDYDEPTDLVAITVETFTARRSYEISAERPGV